MKNTDLATTILAAVIGVIVAFLVCNFMLPEFESVSFKKLSEAETDFTLTEPDVNTFNYRALNPTVEVYVGDCTEYDAYGNCLTEPDEGGEDYDEETPVEPEEEPSDGSAN